MKKLILILLISFSVVSVSSAQENSENKFIDIRAGGIFNYEAAQGELGNYAANYLGGGAAAEFDLDFPLPSFMKTGFAISIMANGGFIKNELLSSMWNLQIIPSAFCRFYLLKKNLIIQPEFGYGIQFNFPEANPDYSNNIEKLYLDQVLEFAVSVRFAPQNLLNGSMEFGLTPFYQLCPEKNEAVHYIGAKFEVYYNF